MAKSYSKGSTTRTASSTTGRIARERVKPLTAQEIAQEPIEKTYRDFANETADSIQEKLKSEYDKATDSLSEDQLKALKGYSDNLYQPINHALRTDEENNAYVIDKAINEIDSAMKEAQGLTENTILYRGVKSYPEIYNLQEGDSFTDKGYFSTSFHEETPMMFLGFGNQRVLIQIKADKGTKGIYLDHPRFVQSDAWESELLMKRNTTFKVNKVSTKETSKGQIKLLEVELV